MLEVFVKRALDVAEAAKKAKPSHGVVSMKSATKKIKMKASLNKADMNAIKSNWRKLSEKQKDYLEQNYDANGKFLTRDDYRREVAARKGLLEPAKPDPRGVVKDRHPNAPKTIRGPGSPRYRSSYKESSPIRRVLESNKQSDWHVEKLKGKTGFGHASEPAPYIGHDRVLHVKDLLRHDSRIAKAVADKVGLSLGKIQSKRGHDRKTLKQKGTQLEALPDQKKRFNILYTRALEQKEGLESSIAIKKTNRAHQRSLRDHSDAPVFDHNKKIPVEPHGKGTSINVLKARLDAIKNAKTAAEKKRLKSVNADVVKLQEELDAVRALPETKKKKAKMRNIYFRLKNIIAGAEE